MTDDDWQAAETRRHNRDTFRDLRWPEIRRPRYKFTDMQMQIALRSLEKKETNQWPH